MEEKIYLSKKYQTFVIFFKWILNYYKVKRYETHLSEKMAYLYYLYAFVVILCLLVYTPGMMTLVF